MNFYSTGPADIKGANFWTACRHGIMATHGYIAAKSWAKDTAPGTWRGIWRIKEIK